MRMRVRCKHYVPTDTVVVKCFVRWGGCRLFFYMQFFFFVMVNICQKYIMLSIVKLSRGIYPPLIPLPTLTSTARTHTI